MRARLALAVAVAAVGIAAAQQATPPSQAPIGVGQTPSALPLSHPIRERGSSVTGAYEGWYRAPDGATTLLVGYFNRNTQQELDVPIGPDNRIEPGGPDRGQPTHFLTGRQWGVFTIRVPDDVGTTKLAWTIVSNEFTNTITLHTRPEWVVEPFEDAQKNTPPVFRFERGGPPLTGPPTIVAAHYSAATGQPLPLVVWVSDEGPRLNIAPPARKRSAAGAAPAEQPPVTVAWSKFRGPGRVSFDRTRPPIDSSDGRAVATATFDAPGEYTLRAEANDSSGPGGGGFQCCWTNVHVGVTVK